MSTFDVPASAVDHYDHRVAGLPDHLGQHGRTVLTHTATGATFPGTLAVTGILSAGELRAGATGNLKLTDSSIDSLDGTDLVLKRAGNEQVRLNATYSRLKVGDSSLTLTDTGASGGDLSLALDGGTTFQINQNNVTFDPVGSGTTGLVFRKNGGQIGSIGIAEGGGNYLEMKMDAGGSCYLQTNNLPLYLATNSGYNVTISPASGKTVANNDLAVTRRLRVGDNASPTDMVELTSGAAECNIVSNKDSSTYSSGIKFNSGGVLKTQIESTATNDDLVLYSHGAAAKVVMQPSGATGSFRVNKGYGGTTTIMECKNSDLSTNFFGQTHHNDNVNVYAKIVRNHGGGSGFDIGESGYRFSTAWLTDVDISTSLLMGADNAAKPTTSAWSIVSDSRVKEDVEEADLEHCLAQINGMRLKTFRYNEKMGDGFEARKYVGVLADDMLKLNPRTVSVGPKRLIDGSVIEDFKTFNVHDMLMHSFGAIQVLTQRVAQLEQALQRVLGESEGEGGQVREVQAPPVLLRQQAIPEFVETEVQEESRKRARKK